MNTPFISHKLYFFYTIYKDMCANTSFRRLEDLSPDALHRALGRPALLLRQDSPPDALHLHHTSIRSLDALLFLHQIRLVVLGEAPRHTLRASDREKEREKEKVRKAPGHNTARESPPEDEACFRRRVQAQLARKSRNRISSSGPKTVMVQAWAKTGASRCSDRLKPYANIYIYVYMYSL